jgi:hypothetical protein
MCCRFGTHDDHPTVRGFALLSPVRCTIGRHHSWRARRAQALATMIGERWPFSKKGKNDHKAGSSSGGRHHCPPSPPPPIHAPPPPPRRTLLRPPQNRVYVRVKQARRLYARNQPFPWPDVNLPAHTAGACRCCRSHVMGSNTSPRSTGARTGTLSRPWSEMRRVK